MNRSLAIWISLITALTLVAIAIATVGLVLGAKASDEKADPADVSAQVDELRAEVGSEIDEVDSAIEQVAGAVDTLASELASDEAQQNDAIEGVGAAVDDLQQRVDEIETLLGLDSP
jgi:flagellar basal body-associated protein FliL